MGTLLRRCLLLPALGLLLAGCATVPPLPQVERLLDDAAFAAPSEPVDAAQPFALSERMRHYLEVEIAPQLRRKGARDGLVEALASKGQLRIEYDAASTRTAAQAFDARAGNCLSLVVMTAAMARHLGVPVEFNDVVTEEGWARAGDLMVNAGHVNLTLGQRLVEDRLGRDSGRTVMVDFDPPSGRSRPLVRSIGERTVVAMFMNNRAAESLVAGRVDDAYWWVRGALLQEPTFTPSYNTLAVVYQRHGRPQQAERVLRYLLEREPANTALLANLVNALRAQGRGAEAEAVAQRLEKIEPMPPFHWYQQGVAALERRDYAAARDAFTREVERSAYYHEFHFGLALAYAGLGDFTRARREAELALQHSSTGRERQLYTAKLEWLEKKRGTRVQ